jgi:hypothetical protein
MSKVSVGRAKTVNVRQPRAVGVSVSAGGVGLLVVVILAVTHQRTTEAVFQAVVWGLALVGGGTVAYGVWWFRQRTAPVPGPVVCSCQQHRVPGHAELPAPPPVILPPPGPAQLPGRPVYNFYGDQAAAAAMEAMRRDAQEG